VTGADLTHIDTWLFDLDNTLYPLDSGLGLIVSERITDFVADLTGLAREAAHALQKKYLIDHGLTLRGLMLHHGVDPDVYHANLRDLPLERLVRDEPLIAALKRLPGRRLIFTNADAGHAARVLTRLGLEALFDDVFHIGSAAFNPKPSRESFDAIIAAHAIAPARTAFFEDAPHNLEPAAALGMTTILVGPAPRPAFVDFAAPKLAAFLASARVSD